MQGNDTRAQILERAAELFAARGLKGTTIRDVAAASGLNSQLIYYYFGNKTGLFREVVTASAERGRSVLREAAAGGDPPRERLTRVVRRWVAFVLAEAPVIRMVIRALQEGDPEVADAIRERVAGNARLIRGILEEGVRDGSFRADLDAGLAAGSLVGMVQWYAIASPVLPRVMEVEEQGEFAGRLADHTINLLLRGIERERDHP